jgi:hypothetical protein
MDQDKIAEALDYVAQAIVRHTDIVTQMPGLPTGLAVTEAGKDIATSLDAIAEALSDIATALTIIAEKDE